MRESIIRMPHSGQGGRMIAFGEVVGGWYSVIARPRSYEALGGFAKFAGDFFRGRADAIDYPLQLFAANPETLHPVLHLVILVHVDAAAVRLAAVCLVVCHSGSPFWRENAVRKR
jgi:hypothetical protein